MTEPGKCQVDNRCPDVPVVCQKHVDQQRAAVDQLTQQSREKEELIIDMTGVLQAAVKKHNLGYGGERVDQLVVTEIDALKIALERLKKEGLTYDKLYEAVRKNIRDPKLHSIAKLTADRKRAELLLDEAQSERDKALGALEERRESEKEIRQKERQRALDKLDELYLATAEVADVARRQILACSNAIRWMPWED